MELKTAGGRLNIKMSSYQHRHLHIKDKTVSRPSYLQHGNPILGKDGLYIETGLGSAKLPRADVNDGTGFYRIWVFIKCIPIMELRYNIPPFVLTNLLVLNSSWILYEYIWDKFFVILLKCNISWVLFIWAYKEQGLIYVYGWAGSEPMGAGVA